MISQKIYGDSRKLELLLPGFPLSDSGPEGTDDSQEPVAGDGGERHDARHHAEDCVEDSNLAEYRREVVLVFVTQLPGGHQLIKLPACQDKSRLVIFPVYVLKWVSGNCRPPL